MSQKDDVAPIVTGLKRSTSSVNIVYEVTTSVDAGVDIRHNAAKSNLLVLIGPTPYALIGTSLAALSEDSRPATSASTSHSARPPPLT